MKRQRLRNWGTVDVSGKRGLDAAGFFARLRLGQRALPKVFVADSVPIGARNQ